MDPVANPYQPGAGRRPPELAGRAAIIEDAQILMRRCAEDFGDRGRILHGLRGVGKTVLLNEFYSLAEQAGWIVAKVEGSPARPQIARYIAQGLHRSLREATGRFDTGRPSGRWRCFGPSPSRWTRAGPTPSGSTWTPRPVTRTLAT